MAIRDKNQTLAQNFRRLGLSAHLNAPTGGVENNAAAKLRADPLHISGPTSKLRTDSAQQASSEVTVERDPETGKITRVVRPEDEEGVVEIAGKLRRRGNPLNDPLEDALRAPLSADAGAGAGAGDEAGAGAKSDVVKALEEQAARQTESLLQKRKPKQQSTREVEWLERLIAKHGDNVQAMARDMKLNPMQQAPADIRRRLKKYHETHDHNQ